MRKIRSLSEIAAALAIAVICAGTARAQTSDPPHILFIMSDDHAWPLYSFMYDNGHRYIDESGQENLRPVSFPALTRDNNVAVPAVPMTPHLDRLANRGVIFPRGYSADSVCVPSFATTQSGLNRKDSGVLHASGFPKKLNGRNVGGIGDYVSHIPYPAPIPSYDSLAFGKSWNSYKPLGFTCAEGPGDKCKAVKQGHYRFQGLLDEIAASLAKGPEQRWFAWYSPHLPHADFDGRAFVDSGVAQCAADPTMNFCPPNGNQKFCPIPAASGKPLELPTKYFKKDKVCQRLRDLQVRMMSAEECFANVVCGQPVPPECSAWGANLCAPGYEYVRFKKIYRDLVYTIMLEDFWIGLLLDFIENDTTIVRTACGGEPCTENWACCNDVNVLQGIANDTLMLYQTDNGMIPDEAVGADALTRGWKKSVGENGFRTPILVSLPRVLTGPVVKDDLVHAVDLIPTMLDFATDYPVPTCAVGEKPRPPRWNPTPTPGGPSGTPTPGWVAANATPRAAGTPPCFEGRSLRPAMTSGATPANAKRKYLFAQKGSKVFLRTEDDYRLFRKGCASDKFQLFHVTGSPPPGDLDETCDLLGGCPGTRPSDSCICYLETQLNLWYSTTKPCSALSAFCQSSPPPSCP